MKKKLVIFLALATVVTVTSSCFILFQNPLGTKKYKVSKKLMGTWSMEIKFGKNVKKTSYKVTAQKGNLIKVKNLTKRKKKSKRKKKPIWGYVVEFDKQLYLHFYKPKKKEEGLQIFPIEILNDKEVKLMIFSPKKIKALGEKNAIKVIAKKKMLVRVEESTESLRALIKKEGLKNLLSKDSYILKKIK